MKKSKIFWGLFLIAIAVLLLLEAFGVILPLTDAIGEISVFSAAIGLLFLVLAVSRLFCGAIHEMFFPLAIAFAIFEKNVAFLLGREDTNLIHNGVLFLIALLLTIGTSLLFKGHKGIFRITGKRTGRSTVYVDCTSFVSEQVENNMGSCTVHFTNTDSYTGGGVLNVENNMGAFTVRVPSTWNVCSHVENNMGAITIPEGDGGDGPTLTLTGENNMGSLKIEYV